MPLIKSKSKKAVGKNIKAEMAAGKVQVEQVDPAIEASFIRSARCSSTASGG
jgi:hypothetical protein